MRHKIGKVRRGALTAALAFTAGCGGGGGDGGSANGGGGGVPPNTRVSVSKSASLGSLYVTLAQDTSTISRGGTVTYTLSVVNPASASGPVEVVGKAISGTDTVPRATLALLDPNGQPPFHVISPAAAPGPPPPPGVRLITLQPGQSLSLTQARTVFTLRGQYRATATFQISGSFTVAPKLIVVGPLPVTVQ